MNSRSQNTSFPKFAKDIYACIDKFADEYSDMKRARSLHLTALFLLSCGPQWSGEASSWDVTASMAQHDGAVGAAHAATLLILPRLSGLCLALRGGRTPTGGLWRDMPAPRPTGASLKKKIAAPIKMGSHGFAVQRTPVDLSVLLARSLCSFARMCARPLVHFACSYSAYGIWSVIEATNYLVLPDVTMLLPLHRGSSTTTLKRQRMRARVSTPEF